MARANNAMSERSADEQQQQQQDEQPVVLEPEPTSQLVQQAYTVHLTLPAWQARPAANHMRTRPTPQ